MKFINGNSFFIICVGVFEFICGDFMVVASNEIPAICRICKQWDKNKNLVTATVTLQEVTWAGSAHLSCIKKYNKIHKEKYSICEYDENDNFLGTATPI